MGKYIIAVLGCTAAAGLCTTQALAQSASRSSQYDLPTVVVEQNNAARRQSTPNARQGAPTADLSAEGVDSGDRQYRPVSSTTISGDAIASQKAATNDTAQLLSNAAGVSLYQSGGLSSLPVIRGMEDDRVRVLIDGMAISSACGNHMNPPLSYIDPEAVQQIQVMAGITPVSAGGDSIGGTIKVDSKAPRFAAPGEGVITYGTASVFVRGNGISTGGSASAATSHINITYTGSWARSDDYKDGNGNTVKSSLYEAQNHALSLSVKNNNDLFTIQGGIQHIPYQGFPNAYMDMTDNTAWFVNAHYAGHFAWGKLDLRTFYQDTRHEMDFLSDGNKAQYYMGGFPMPMNTHGQNFGYTAKGEVLLSPRDLVRIGSEFHGFLLDDWWPPVAGTMMMGPRTFWNINGGSRYDLGTFIEWERKWDRQWTTLLGVRNDVVWMNTGTVSGYNTSVYDADATAFNAADRARTDVNFDATALVRYDRDRWSTIEAGYAMKTRSPNLYERYAWSTNSMAAMMVGWFGDGNQYVGNIDLKPETAHTLSVSYALHDGPRKEWELKVTPYYTYVQDYIDVDRCGMSDTKLMMMTSCLDPANKTATAGSVALKFANHDAEIYGFDISGRVPLGYSEQFGKFALSGVVGYVHGRNLDTGDSLYHMMPIKAKLALEHQFGKWSNVAELQLVGAKTDVEQVRNELQTPGYALVNLRSSYELGQVRFDAGIENLFDQQYYSPLGGVYLGDGAVGANLLNGGMGTPLAGMGRTVYGGITVRF